MFCEKCGSEIKDDDVFCPSCGAKVEELGEGKPVPTSIVDNKSVMPEAASFEASEGVSDSGMNKEETLKSNNQVQSETMSSAREFEKNLNNGNVQAQGKSYIRLKTNGFASAFKVVGWIVMGLGGFAGLIIIIYSLSKSGSNSYSSMFAGLGSGAGIIILVTSILSSLGFLAVGEIIQLLEDQKTIMIVNSKVPIKKRI